MLKIVQISNMMLAEARNYCVWTDPDEKIYRVHKNIPLERIPQESKTKFLKRT